MADEWKELTSGEVIKMDEGDRVDGVFVSIAESTMYPDSFALTMTIDGEQKTTFVNNIVKDLLGRHNVQPGEEISVLYVGMKDNKDKTRKYKDFKVFKK